MDLFTHVVFAYLLSFVLWGPTQPWYIAAGAVAGGLPDSDVLLFPLSRRFPIFRHHGITHSLLGTTLIAGVGSVLLPYVLAPFIPGTVVGLSLATTGRFFLAMEVGGFSHVFLDGFTHFAVPPFIPFSSKEFRLEADVAINVSMTCLTIVTLVVLATEHSSVSFNVWVETAWIFVAIYGGYLLLRGTARWRAGVARKAGGFSAVIPRTNPFIWFLVDEKITAERYEIRYRRYELGRGYAAPERRLSVPKVTPAPGAVTTPEDAIARSYLPAMQRSRFLKESYHFGEAAAEPGGFQVVWFTLEFGMMGRAPGVRAHVDGTTGAVRVESAFLRPPADAGL